MKVGIRRRIREGGMFNLDLWKIDKVVLREDQKKPGGVTEEDEKSSEAEDKDISTNSIRKGPHSTFFSHHVSPHPP